MTVIRPAIWQDLPELTKLVHQEAHEARSLLIRLWRKDTQILVAAKDGGLVGLIAMRLVRRGQSAAVSWPKKMGRKILPFSESDPDAILLPIQVSFIEAIYVTPALRRQGLATALVQRSPSGPKAS